MEAGPPPVVKHLIGFDIWGIYQVSNEVVATPIEYGTWAIQYKPLVESGVKILSIEITNTMYIDEDSHVIHKSNTDFSTNGLSISGLKAGDDTIDLLVELGIMAFSHARMLFHELNKELTPSLPPMLFGKDFRHEVIRQFQAIS